MHATRPTAQNLSSHVHHQKLKCETVSQASYQWGIPVAIFTFQGVKDDPDLVCEHHQSNIHGYTLISMHQC